MAGVTTGKIALPFPDENDTIVPHEFMPATMQAVADEIALRSRMNFDWADGVEMAAQTKMVEGSRGFRRDTKTEFIYSLGQWRLATPHVEFTANNGNFPNNTLQYVGIFARDDVQSTDPEMVTIPANGILQFTNPGVYAVSTVTAMRNAADTAYAAATGRTFLDLSTVANEANIQRVTIPVGEDRGSMAVPNLRITVANQRIYFQIFRNVADEGGRFTTRARITRLA